MTNPSTGEGGSSQKATMGDVTNYGKELDLTKGLPIESDLNGYISWRIDLYEQIFRYRDYNLWEAYVEDFEGFTETLFQAASKTYVRKLRDFLRANGVYVHRQARVSMAKELFKVLQEDEPHEWTKEEIENQINSSDGFNSFLKSRFPAISTTPAIVTTVPPPPTTVTTTIRPAVVTTTTSAPPTVATITGHGRELGNLAKMYEDKMKYGGAMDSFDHKLTIFHDLCGKADIPRDTYSKAFSTMLDRKSVV